MVEVGVTAEVAIFFDFSNVCLNSSASSAVLKRAANFSNFPSPSAKSIAAHIHVFLLDFISVNLMSGVTEWLAHILNTW